MAPDAAMALWPELEPYVEAALARDPFESVTVAEVAEQLADADAQLLLAVDDGDILGAAVVQMFRVSGGGKVIHVLTTAGDKLDRWLDQLVERLVELAGIYDACGVTLSGRPGWTKTLRKYGFKTDHVQMRLEVA